MILKRVEITDFLSVKGKLPIDFDKKITIFLGANDHGKSNILVALEHLNEDNPIKEDEANWDAKGVPTISFILSLDADEAKLWKAIVEKQIQKMEDEAAEPEEEVEEEESAPKGAFSSSVSASAKKPSATQAVESKGTPLPAAVLNPSLTTMTLTRTGIGTSLQLEGVDLDDLPVEMNDFIDEGTPRVELFRALSGALQDSAMASNIMKDEFEFLQGVFFYAGIDPRESTELFTQNDKTMRDLDKASGVLDAQLRGLWGQGTDLHFRLRHKGDQIEFLADDPSITSRVARMSKRSAGVTQFFRVSMVLHARERKFQANSHIYIFDEPGVYLHPQGQRDLIQVYETLADENQIVYATHSLFLLNQNFPERHRLIFKDEEGTKVDQKPYRQNWRYATDALGVYLTSNILFSNRILLVEGDSDPIFTYELFRQLNKLGETDVDLNTVGIMSFYDYQNLRFLLQVFKRESQGTSVLVLVDGDAAGKSFAQRATDLCKRLSVQIVKLPDGRSSEDYVLYDDQFLMAVRKTLENACEAEGKTVPKDLEERIRKSWDEHRVGREKPEKKEKTETPDAKKERITTGRWFKNVTKEILDDEASKVVLARNYAEICRDAKDEKPGRERVKEARTLCQDVATKLDTPRIRAERNIEGTPSGE